MRKGSPRTATAVALAAIALASLGPVEASQRNRGLSTAPIPAIYRTPSSTGGVALIASKTSAFQVTRNALKVATPDGILGVRFSGGKARSIDLGRKVDVSLSSFIGCNRSGWFGPVNGRNSMRLVDLYEGVDLDLSLDRAGALRQRLIFDRPSAAQKVTVAPIGGTLRVDNGSIVVSGGDHSLTLGGASAWRRDGKTATLLPSADSGLSMVPRTSSAVLDWGVYFHRIATDHGHTVLAGGLWSQSSALVQILAPRSSLAAVGFLRDGAVRDTVLLGARDADLRAQAVAAAPDGSAIIGGAASGRCTPELLGGLPFTPGNAEASDAFMASIAPDGVLTWADRFGAAGDGHDDTVLELAVSDAGQVAAMGETWCPRCFPKRDPVQPIVGRSDREAFLVVRDQRGAVRTSGVIGGFGAARAVGWDGDEVLVAGSSYAPDRIPTGARVNGTPDVSYPYDPVETNHVLSGDAYVHRINPGRSLIVETSFIGGPGKQRLDGAAIRDDRVALAITQDPAYALSHDTSVVYLTRQDPVGAWTTKIASDIRNRYIFEMGIAPNGSVALLNEEPFACSMLSPGSCPAGDLFRVSSSGVAADGTWVFAGVDIDVRDDHVLVLLDPAMSVILQRADV